MTELEKLENLRQLDTFYKELERSLRLFRSENDETLNKIKNRNRTL